MRDVGKNIKSLRTKQKMTQDELAQQLFVTRQTVSNYENGISRPDVDMLLKIAQVFEVDVSAVIYGPQKDPEQKKKGINTGILLGSVILGGLLLAQTVSTLEIFLEHYAQLHYVYFYSLRVLWGSWLRPAWLLLTGWAMMRTLCVFCGTKTIPSPASRYIKWAILSLIGTYTVLVLPHSIWLMWNDLQVLQKVISAEPISHSGYFSIFPLWDRVALLMMGFALPQNVLQTTAIYLPYLSLPFGAVCDCAEKQRKNKEAACCARRFLLR